MKKKPKELIRLLIDNKINRQDMENFFDGLDDVQTLEIYEDYLKNHYDEIMEAYQKKILENKQKNNI